MIRYIWFGDENLERIGGNGRYQLFPERSGWTSRGPAGTQKFAEAAIADSKRKGLFLAVRARWVALAVTAVTLPIINPNWDVIYYVLMLIPFAVIGWAQLKVGKAGRSGPELFLMFCDLALLTFLAIVPNPLTGGWPLGMQFRFNTFSYFYIFLATATLAYSWRTVVAMGFWTSGLWAIGVAWIYLQPETHAALSNACEPPSAPTTECSTSSTPQRSASGHGSRKSSCS